MALQITWLGSASFRLEDANGNIVYLDPWLDADPGNPGCPIGVNDVERADLVIVTHGDPAHYGRGDAARIAARTGCTFASNPALSAWVVEEGTLPAAQVVTLNFWEPHDFGFAEVTNYPVIHPPYANPSEQATMSEPNTGFAIRMGGVSVLYTGDTVPGDEVYKDVAAKFEPTIGLLPINPADNPARGTVQDSVDLAASIAKMASLRYVIPHYRYRADANGPTVLQEQLRSLDIESPILLPGETVLRNGA